MVKTPEMLLKPGRYNAMNELTITLLIILIIKTSTLTLILAPEYDFARHKSGLPIDNSIANTRATIGA